MEFNSVLEVKPTFRPLNINIYCSCFSWNVLNKISITTNLEVLLFKSQLWPSCSDIYGNFDWSDNVKFAVRAHISAKWSVKHLPTTAIRLQIYQQLCALKVFNFWAYFVGNCNSDCFKFLLHEKPRLLLLLLLYYKETRHWCR